MPWWLDLLLLLSAAAFWWSASREVDDVWGLLKGLLALVSLVVVLVGGRQVLLELLALAFTFWLPSSTSPYLWSGSAGRLPAGRPTNARQQRSRSVRGNSSAMAPSLSRAG
ncbi:MAG: hypothetical protein AAFX65_06165 [Cyanobacteria bacterium J06638_7]